MDRLLIALGIIPVSLLNAITTGAIVMASGRVPKIDTIFMPSR